MAETRESTSKPGIYALASLDGSPLNPADSSVLGLHAEETRHASGIQVRSCDGVSLEPSLSFHANALTLTAFAGYLDEKEELAAALRADASLPPARLAAMALDRFGADAARRMTGEWSLLHWSSLARELTLLGSENTRDPLFWTTNGKQLAVAPDALLLGRISWAGLTLDPQGFALELGRAATRRIRNGGGTVWKGIDCTEPATRHTFSLGVHRTLPPPSEPAVSPFRGSFEDAIDALTMLGRRIVGQNMRRYGRSAFLLSGGLDSTLLAALGAQEGNPANGMICLTSVAPESSGLPDERSFSAAVATQLGAPQRWVCPPPGASVYQPKPATFACLGAPAVSQRHYLYEALWRAASAEGVRAVFDGVMGEMTITEKPRLGYEPNWLRRRIYGARLWRLNLRQRSGWPIEGFHARLAPQLLHNLPPEWKQVYRSALPQRPRLRTNDLRGFHPALKKNTHVGTGTPHGLRRILPYRDRRLARFAASLPFGFGEHQGQDRAMARAMLRGHVPESVRLRSRGLPFSPDYRLRIAQQASFARTRVQVFREAGIGTWLDLPWLEAALDRLAAGANPLHPLQSQAQTTAMAAEFLFWCRTRDVAL